MAKLLEKRWAAPLAAFLFPALCLLGIYAAVGVWPFGGSTPLTGDMGGIYLPMMASMRRDLLEGTSLLYSFSKSLGGEILSSYFTSGDMLAMLFFLFTPAAHLPDVLVPVYLLRIGLTGLLGWWFVSGQPGGSRWWAVALGWCYALCAYGMAYLQNAMWLNTAMLAPLVLLAMQRLERPRWRVAYPLLLGLAVGMNFYSGYMLCLFTGLFFLYDLVANHTGEVRGTLLKRTGVFAGCSVLGAGLGAVVLVQVVTAAGRAKGGLFALEGGFETNFDLIDLTQSAITGNFQHDYLAGWLPFLYCGYLAMVAAVAWFFCKGVPGRTRLAGGVLALMLGLSLWLELPNLIWHGFKAPIWFEYRWSFLCILFLVYLAGGALARWQQVPVGPLIGIGVAFLAAIGVGMVRAGFGLRTVLPSLLLLPAVVALLVLWRKGIWRRTVPVLLAMCVMAELGFSGWNTGRRFEYRDRAQYISHVEGTGALLEQMQAGYRAETGWFYTLNDPLLFGYMGTSFFNSVQDTESNMMLEAFGVTDGKGLASYTQLLGLRYWLAEEGDLPSGKYGFVYTEGRYVLWEDEAAYPLLFAADGGWRELERNEGSRIDPNTLWRHLTGIDIPVWAALAGPEWEVENLAAQPDEASGGALYRVEDPAVASVIRLRVALPQAGTVYLGLRSPDHVGVGVYTQTTAADDVTGGLVDCGSYTAGEEAVIEIRVGANEIRLADIEVYLEDAGALEIHREALESGQPAGYTAKDGHVAGTIMAEAGQVLYTSIPYADGWQATVNGEAVESYPVAEMLLGLDLVAGENRVELVWRPRGLMAGAVISGVSWLVLTIMAVLEVARQRRRR